MKKVLLLGAAALFMAGCGASPQAQNQAAVSPAPPTSAAQKPGGEISVASHSTENQFPPAKGPESGAPNTASGNSPMARAVDVGALTAEIEKAAKAYKKAPKDETAKIALADAYFERATALTDAAQYRAALGDFRKGLKLNPNDKEAKDMHDQIISIFKSIGREPPEEGKEPPPMPVK
jgi:tetratricopeptide (TPR) repeat protein